MREIKVYILLFWLSFTAVRSQQDVSPPRILNGEQLLVNGGPVTLTCEGHGLLIWTYKYQDCHYDMGKQTQMSKTDGSYRSQLTLNDHNRQGHYHCHYNNTSLSDPGASVSTYVYIFSDKERFAQMDPDLCQDSRITGNVGGQVVLDCRPTQPNLTVVVEHGEEEIHRGPLEDPRAGYELRNLTEDSSGKYRCSVHNFSKVFEVEVQGTLKPPKLGIIKNTFPVVGYSMHLFCQIPNNKFQSEPAFKWIRFNKDNRTFQTLPEHYRVQSDMYYTSYRLVLNVALEDSGTYECTVRTEGQPPLQTAMYISIKESGDPFLKVSPVTQNITLRVWDQLVWKLEVESFPPFPIIETSSKFDVTQDEDGTTELKKYPLTPSDFGEHTVNLSTRSHSLGVKTAQVHLYLKVKSKTKLNITRINAIERPNSTVTIGCTAIGYPMESITWHHQSCPNGEPCLQPFSDLKCSQITYAVHKENHHSSECSFVATESARIRCRSGEKTKSADIMVSEFAEPLSFMYNGNCTMVYQSTTSYCTVKETDSFTLTCAASKFRFDSVELRFSPTDKGVFDEDFKEIGTFDSSHHNHISTFDVATASRRHQGRYDCIGDVDISSRGIIPSDNRVNERTRTIYLDVLKERRNMLPKDYRKVEMVGDAFTFDCSYFGPPPEDIIWTKDGQPLPGNFGEFRENNQTMTIPHLDPTIHTGHYVCERGGKLKKTKEVG
ncbi:vascular endothelial growth factor receptor kdr-like [Macrobrachium nipponense]|uniref:vascular endothelial growth factor receptor kdr-like n=1 Tax=Macrobrachium nipponense TaxID=159736 RepID=UPI0030C8856C